MPGDQPSSDGIRSGQPVPGHAEVILVPLANPDTAAVLLSVAAAMAAVEHGRVVGLVVMIGEAIAEKDRAHNLEIEQILAATVESSGVEMEFLIREAPSVARGILDTALEVGADLLLLGARRTSRGHVVLGSVVDSVLDTAPCDAAVLRTPQSGKVASPTRIVVPVDGSTQSRAAAQLGVILGTAFSVSVEVMHVQASGDSRALGLGEVELSLDGVDGADQAIRTVVNAPSAASGILGHISESDLVVMGASSRNQVAQWLFGNTSLDVLEQAPGTVLVLSRSNGARGVGGRVRQRLRRFRPQLTAMEQETVTWQAQSSAGLSIDFLVLITVAALLASFGLLQNSAAVIIGAMLVAPLLGPLTAFSVGMVTARLALLRRSLGTIAVGSGIAVMWGFLVGWASPIVTPTTELLARTRPSLLDGGVALAAGVVGAYAAARKDIPAALAGVAIAAALVPPICTVGLGLAAGDLDIARGALLLFVTNIVSVAVVGSVVFRWFGMRPTHKDHRQRWQYLSAVMVAAVALPAVFLLLRAAQEESVQVIVASDLETLFDGAEVTDLRTTEGETLLVTAVIRTPEEITIEQVARAESLLETAVGQALVLEVVVEQVIRATAPD
jgi:uncharacterized hydrophobic protein (TIGR00271 family)